VKSFHDLIGSGVFNPVAKKFISSYFLFRGLSVAINYLSQTFFVLFILDEFGATKAGLILSAYFLTSSLLDYPTGVISDYLGQKIVLFFAFITYSLSFYILGSATTDFTLILGIMINSFSMSQQSGAIETWFDNNYKILENGLDKDRKLYRLITARIGVTVEFLGGFMLLLGGYLSVTQDREFVFTIQSILYLILSFIVLFYFKSHYKREKTKENSNYLIQFKLGIYVVTSNKVLLGLVIAFMIHTAVLNTYANFGLFPLYFGYTGSDLGASYFRFSLFVAGSIATWFIASWIKGLEVKVWLRRIHLAHTIFFLPVMGMLFFYFPIKNEYNPTAIVLFALTIFFGHLMRRSIQLILQRIYLDLVEDEMRNAFYSLLPSLSTLLISPFIALSGYFVDYYGLPLLFVPLTLAILLSTILYFKTLKLIQDD